MKINFRDYFGIYFLGANYNPNIWKQIQPKGNALKMFSYEEMITDKIFTVAKRNLGKQLPTNLMREYFLDISTDDINCKIDVAFFENEAQKESKIIEKAIIISYSTGLKSDSAIKLQFIKNIARKSGWRIKNLEIAYIDGKHRGNYQETKFIFSKYFNISNTKKSEMELKNVLIEPFLLDNKICSLEPYNNKGNSQDYARRANYSFIQSDKDFFRNIDNYKFSNYFQAPAIAPYQVRSNEKSKYWLQNNDLINWEEGESNSIKFESGTYSVVVNPSLNLDKSVLVFFDFETICLPFSAFDNFLPYQQIPVQYTVIKTDKNRNIISSKSVVLDFENIDKIWDYFSNLVRDIFNEEALYIAHHKIFENSCLIGMLEAFRSEMQDNSDFVDIDNKVFQILLDRNSIDTNVIFKNSFEFEDFVGKSSIKFLNGWMSKFRRDLLTKHNVVSYEDDLEIKNGIVAQEKLTELYFGFHNNESRSAIIDSLKKYCENDVKSMIPLIDFILENVKKS